MKPHEIRKLRENLTNTLEHTKLQLQQLQEDCPHTNIKNEWGTGVCFDCGYRTHGWYCPKNPDDFECEYEEDEWCIHCGEPEERK